MPPADLSLPVDVDSELSQFRNELRQFQSTVEDVGRETKETESNSDRISTQQRQELLDLMTKLARKGRPKPDSKIVRMNPGALRPAEPLPIDVHPAESELANELNSHPRPGQSSDVEMDADAVADTDDEIDETLEVSKPLDPNNPLVTGDVADAFALGKVLFRNGDFVNAEKALRKAVVEPENEMTVKYLTATCLRRQKRWRRATEMYQVVANSERDPILQKLSKWQIENIRWQQESEAQLKQLRQQREKQSQPKKNAAADSGTVER
jgi:hypothetical protein